MAYCDCLKEGASMKKLLVFIMMIVFCTITISASAIVFEKDADVGTVAIVSGVVSDIRFTPMHSPIYMVIIGDEWIILGQSEDIWTADESTMDAISPRNIISQICLHQNQHLTFIKRQHSWELIQVVKIPV